LLQHREFKDSFNDYEKNKKHTGITKAVKPDLRDKITHVFSGVNDLRDQRGIKVGKAIKTGTGFTCSFNKTAHAEQTFPSNFTSLAKPV
jgi:hypothetical protein